MAKRCNEEFNPWPPFVDLFSSVILVLLLFLLITIVNIAYYSQFKFKVNYVGTVASEQIISNENQPIDVNMQKETQPKPLAKKTFEPETLMNEGDIESAGKDLTRIYEDEPSQQITLSTEDYLILNFANSEIKIDNPTILLIKEFISKVKKKYPKHIIKISAVDPTNQISATVMKQISLARTLNARNLIRQQAYDIKDVQVDLLKANSTNIKNENESGFLIIRVEKK